MRVLCRLAAMVALTCAMMAQSASAVEVGMGAGVSVPLLEQREERVNPKVGTPFIAYTARPAGVLLGREWVTVSLASERSVLPWGGEVEAHLNLATDGKVVGDAHFQLAGGEEKFGVFDAENQVVRLRYEDLVKIQLLYQVAGYKVGTVNKERPAFNPGQFRELFRLQLVVEVLKGVRMTDTFFLFFHRVRESSLWVSQTFELEFTNWASWEPSNGDSRVVGQTDPVVPAETLREIARFYRMVGWSKADPVSGGMGAFYHAQRPQSQLWSNAAFVEVKFRESDGSKATKPPRKVVLVMFVDPSKLDEVSTASICPVLQKYASREASLKLVQPSKEGEEAPLKLPASVYERLAGRPVQPLVFEWIPTSSADTIFVVNKQVVDACYDDMKLAVLAHSGGLGEVSGWSYADGGYNGDIVPLHTGTEVRTFVYGEADEGESELLSAFGFVVPNDKSEESKKGE